MVSSHSYYSDNRSLFLTKNTYKYYYTYAGADITSCTKNGDTPMYLAVYSITKQLQEFDPICINILYNAGTVTLYQFQQNSCSPLSYCKHYQSKGYTTTSIATTTATTTTTTHKAYFFLAHISSPTDLTQLNWFYTHFWYENSFYSLDENFELKKKLNLFVYDIN